MFDIISYQYIFSASFKGICLDGRTFEITNNIYFVKKSNPDNNCLILNNLPKLFDPDWILIDEQPYNINKKLPTVIPNHIRVRGYRINEIINVALIKSATASATGDFVVVSLYDGTIQSILVEENSAHEAVKDINDFILEYKNSHSFNLSGFHF